MQQTLFFIPHQIAGVNLFGMGWLLGAWILGSLGWIGWLVFRKKNAAAVLSYLPFIAVVALAIAFFFPMLEAKDPDGQTIGLPVRGYGTFVVMGVLLGIGWAIRRAERKGISGEAISSLAVWMLLAGFVGARLFYVIEYWEREFHRPTWRETLIRVSQITEGGLVVYGALIAALIALLVFCRRYAISPRVLGDIVAPSLVIGLACGRIGCLMNGCCYGGLCESGPFCLQFPQYNSVIQRTLSPPYHQQLEQGRLHGFVLGAEPQSHRPIVESVAPQSHAAQAGLRAGTSIVAIDSVPVATMAEAKKALLTAGPSLSLQTSTGELIRWSVGLLPAKSLPVHPAQIYSTIGALVVCLALVACEPYLATSGSLLALLLTLYPPLRIVEEVIRVDEPGQFGTGLSISQLISLALFLFAMGYWAWLYLQRPRRIGDSSKQGRSLSAA